MYGVGYRSCFVNTVWKQLFLKQTLNHSSVRLKTYAGKQLRVIDKKSVLVEYQSQKHVMLVVVVAG